MCTPLCYVIFSDRRASSNAIVMRTGSGDYPLVCPHLVRALTARGLWTDDVRAYLQRSRGVCLCSISSS